MNQVLQACLWVIRHTRRLPSHMNCRLRKMQVTAWMRRPGSRRNWTLRSPGTCWRSYKIPTVRCCQWVMWEMFDIMRNGCVQWCASNVLTLKPGERQTGTLRDSEGIRTCDRGGTLPEAGMASIFDPILSFRLL